MGYKEIGKNLSFADVDVVKRLKNNHNHLKRRAVCPNSKKRYAETVSGLIYWQVMLELAQK